MNRMASADLYLRDVLARYAVDTGQNSIARTSAQVLMPALREWAGQYLIDVQFSGSFAKGTAVRGGTDVDLFISLTSITPDSLAQIYGTLFTKMQGLHCQGQSLQAKQQNVSIGIVLGGTQIDLVPGRRQDQWSEDHSLYKNRAATWTKTNVNSHIRTVQQSNRLEEIRVLKIWRNRRGFSFPSFYLELSVIEALKGKRIGDLSDNVVAVLQYLQSTWGTARIVDPANSANVISDDLSQIEKGVVAAAAAAALQGNWEALVA
jgi:hypothetical protein